MKDPKVEENKIDVLGCSSTPGCQSASDGFHVYIIKLLKVSNFNCYIS